jgi:CheY-like chemotaxis protein
MKMEVLNVDDDKMVLFIHEKMMVHSHFSESPKSFEDGLETLDYIDKHKRDDKKFVIFLDVNMPKLDGWSFMEALDERGISSYCSIFIVTSSIDHLDKQKAETYPVVIGFVEKPLNIDKLQNLKSTEELKQFF